MHTASPQRNLDDLPSCKCGGRPVCETSDGCSISCGNVTLDPVHGWTGCFAATPLCGTREAAQSAWTAMQTAAKESPAIPDCPDCGQLSLQGNYASIDENGDVTLCTVLQAGADLGSEHDAEPQ